MVNYFFSYFYDGFWVFTNGKDLPLSHFGRFKFRLKSGEFSKPETLDPFPAFFAFYNRSLIIC